MAKEPTSMIGHLHSAVQRSGRAVFMNPVTRFIGRTVVEMGERLIPHGANELGNAIYTGSAYAPPVLHTPDQGNVHGTGAAQKKEEPAPKVEQVSSPQPASGWGYQAPMGFREVGYRDNAKIVDMQPQLEGAKQDYNARLEAAAARAPKSDKGQDHVR